METLLSAFSFLKGDGLVNWELGLGFLLLGCVEINGLVDSFGAWRGGTGCVSR